MTMVDSLRDSGLEERKARALVEVMVMTKKAERILDTEKMRDILRGAGFDERKARALIYLQRKAREYLDAQKAHA